MAFEFPDERRGDVLSYLAKREGADSQLELLSVRFDGGTEVQAHVPIYHGKNLISGADINGKATMVRVARGTESSCEDYVKEIAELLRN